MKIYLILLVISTFCGMVTFIDAGIYIRHNYIRIKNTTSIEKGVAFIKSAAIAYFIIPYILCFITNIFMRDTFLEGVENGLDMDCWKLKEDA